MTNPKALEFFFTKHDTEFFVKYPDRMTHARRPYPGENEIEFRSLGDHDKRRRLILLWRVPEGNPAYDPIARPLLKIPFIAFADETIEDRDDILMPIIDDVMRKALQNA